MFLPEVADEQSLMGENALYRVISSLPLRTSPQPGRTLLHKGISMNFTEQMRYAVHTCLLGLILRL